VVGDLYHAAARKWPGKMSCARKTVEERLRRRMSVATISRSGNSTARLCHWRLVAHRAAFRKTRAKIGLYKIKTRTPDTPISRCQAQRPRGASKRTRRRRRGADRGQPCFGLDFQRWRKNPRRDHGRGQPGWAVLLSARTSMSCSIVGPAIVMFHAVLFTRAAPARGPHRIGRIWPGIDDDVPAVGRPERDAHFLGVSTSPPRHEHMAIIPLAPFE